MKKIFIYTIIPVVIIFILILLLDNYTNNTILNEYIENIRNVLFTAFLTMGSFMLTLISIFTSSLKEKLFDNEQYKDKINSIKKY